MTIPTTNKKNNLFTLVLNVLKNLDWDKRRNHSIICLCDYIILMSMSMRNYYFQNKVHNQPKYQKCNNSYQLSKCGEFNRIHTQKIISTSKENQELEIRRIRLNLADYGKFKPILDMKTHILQPVYIAYKHRLGRDLGIY